jgi:probable HAF family extracellular repeat protein
MIHRIQSRILLPGLASAALVCGALPSCGEADCLETKTCTKTQPSTGGSSSFGGRGLGFAPAASQGGAATAGAAPTGSGGEAGGDSGEACSDEGERQCAAAADPTILECSGGVWVVAETCARGELCDRTEADCATIAPGCERFAPGGAFCEDNELVVCGPDLVTVEREACEGRCASGRCVGDGSGGAPSGSGGSSNPNGGSSESGNDAGAPSSDPCSPNPCESREICKVEGDNHRCDPPAFEWLQPLSGWSNCYAEDVSDDGLVVVGECEYTPTGTRAFRWTRAGGMTAIGTLGDWSGAQAISGDGKVIVGNYGIGDVPHWYRWTEISGMEAKDGLGGEVSSEAYDASFDGSVVVGVTEIVVEGMPERRAFRWTERGIQDLGELNTYDGGTQARAVSADGKIVVGSGDGRGFRWTAQTGVVALPDLPIGRGSATAVTRDGSLVAGDTSNPMHGASGVLWSAGADQGEILPGLGQQIRKMSDSGIVVAWEHVWWGELLTTGAALYKAGVELPDDAVGLYAYSISPDSKTWVGFGLKEYAVPFVARAP